MCSRLSLSAGDFAACVIFIIIHAAGFAAMQALSVEQIPQIPCRHLVQVTGFTPCASAEVIARP